MNDTRSPSSSGTRLGSEVSLNASPPTQVSTPLGVPGLAASVTASSVFSVGAWDVNRTETIVDRRSSETSG